MRQRSRTIWVAGATCMIGAALVFYCVVIARNLVVPLKHESHSTVTSPVPHDCPNMQKKRRAWYGPSAYPVASEDELWTWILVFLASIEKEPIPQHGFIEKTAGEINRSNRSSRSSRRTAIIRFPGLDLSVIADAISSSIVNNIDTQTARIQLPRKFCNASACRPNSPLPKRLSEDVLIISAMADDLYDLSQLINCESQAEHLVLSISTERGPTDNERYPAMLYDFLHMLYFEYNWIPFKVDMMKCKEARYGCTFWTAWRKYQRGDEFSYFPPAGNGTVAYEIQRLAGHVQNPSDESCYRRETVGAAYDGEVYVPKNDGQYVVCMDDLKNHLTSSCLVYSFGIGGTWSFEDSMHQLGCTVFSFDPSLSLESHQRAEKHFFYNWALATNYSVLPTQWNITTVDSIYHKLGHNGRHIDVLKMDCETPELTFIDSSGFDQIAPFVHQFAMEVHFFPGGTRTPSDMVRTISRLLHKLEKVGFELFYSRPARNVPNHLDFRSHDGRIRSFNGSQIIVYELSYVKRSSTIMQHSN